MCTVTYIKTSGKVIITSNRDENSMRPVACEPREVVINNSRIYYPKDPQAGGTWFAVTDSGAAVVLLNGAFIKHEKAGPYVRSRGLVVLDTAGDPDPFGKIRKLQVDGIEPFTLVIYKDKRLVEVRWDGSRKYMKELDTGKPHIWSSATLYQPSVIRQRKALFSKFMSTCPDPHEDEVLKFQSDSHNDPQNGFVMDRGAGLRTLSISQAVYEGNTLCLKYRDLQKMVTHELPVPITSNFPPNHEPVRA